MPNERIVAGPGPHTILNAHYTGTFSLLTSALPTITARQREVVELIAAGCSNEEVGERLGISPRTAKAHADALRQKRGETTPESPRFWLNLQARYDLEVERDHLGTKLEQEVRVLDRAS